MSLWELASPVVHMVKNLPAVLETQVHFLAWEDPLKEGMETHSSILACRIPMDRGVWWATVHGVAPLHWEHGVLATGLVCLYVVT